MAPLSAPNRRMMFHTSSKLTSRQPPESTSAVWALYGQLPGDVGIPELGGASGCLTKGPLCNTNYGGTSDDLGNCLRAAFQGRRNDCVDGVGSWSDSMGQLCVGVDDSFSTAAKGRALSERREGLRMGYERYWSKIRKRQPYFMLRF